ncbi:isopentenyl-diphosphate Delta-isomerase [Georgenia sp. AZ-5]|uniref:isopentenyl-diphosphate Delta-isomerase n=1 Tax=Georgenia sp. AZ-5 TaxID=3367526 RepID=UPI0037549BB3
MTITGTPPDAAALSGTRQAPPADEDAPAAVALTPGAPAGSASREDGHPVGPVLHPAFSCYLFGPDGRVLLTRRALTKRSWPGVWTNSFGGRPRAGETLSAALARRAAEHLGVRVHDAVCVLPGFRAAAGGARHGAGPVYLAWTLSQVVPHAAEVMDTRWLDPEELGRAVVSAPWAMTPWLVAQVMELGGLDSTTELAG